MLASARLFRRIAAVLAVVGGISAVGCGKGAYEERLKNTVNQLTQQAAGTDQKEPAAQPEAPANEAAAPANEAAAPANEAAAPAN